MCPGPLRIAQSLIEDRKPQVRLGRLVMALGRSQMRPLGAATSPYCMVLGFGDLLSRRAARAASSQLSRPITQLLNPNRNLLTTPTQLRSQVLLKWRIGAGGLVVAHPAPSSTETAALGSDPMVVRGRSTGAPASQLVRLLTPTGENFS
jgi:hypothetical protein